jgi:hypothetical protein
VRCKDCGAAAPFKGYTSGVEVTYCHEHAPTWVRDQVKEREAAAALMDDPVEDLD